MLTTLFSKTKPIFVCPKIKKYNINRIIKIKIFEPAKENSNSSSEPMLTWAELNEFLKTDEERLICIICFFFTGIKNRHYTLRQ